MNEQTSSGTNGQTKVSRRRFLALAGGVVATGIVACGSGIALVASPIPAVDYGDTVFGGGTAIGGGAKKILVAYASRYGSTASVAQAIGAQLAERGMSVDVQAVEAVDNLQSYDAVVVGSAVRVGKWLPAAQKLVEQNLGALAKVPVAYFCVHFLNTEDTEEARTKRSQYLDPVRALLPARHEAFFAGVLEPGPMSVGDKLATKVVGAPAGDRRDWAAVRAWAGEIFPG